MNLSCFLTLNFEHPSVLLFCFDFDEISPDARTRRPLPSLFFLADQKTKVVPLASDLLTLSDFFVTAELNYIKLDRN